MKIFTPCWGDKYVDLLDRALGTSLRWPKNNKSIEKSEWIILTSDQNEADKIAPIVKDISKSAKLTFHPGGRLIDSLSAAIKVCIDENEPMLMATPDFIYGDGTIDTFKAIANKPGLCASIAHMRVLPDVLERLKGYRIIGPTNKMLIQHGFEFPHASWENSEDGSDTPMSYHGGIRWNRLGDGLFSVQHHLPSPFYCNFLPKDLPVFTGTDFVHWDHTWTSNLITEGRLRYIGSSDAACMIEVTDADLNVPEVIDKEGYFRNMFQNNIQKQFISVFRSS